MSNPTEEDESSTYFVSDLTHKQWLEVRSIAQKLFDDKLYKEMYKCWIQAFLNWINDQDELKDQTEERNLH